VGDPDFASWNQIGDWVKRLDTSDSRSERTSSAVRCRHQEGLEEMRNPRGATHLRFSRVGGRGVVA
jgi:hypothetical protein